MKLESEQITANLLRTLHRYGLINSDTVCKLVDQLQIKLFTRYLKSKEQPDQP